MILGTICARGGSKGIPRKNIRNFYGKPLVLWTVYAAQKCRTLDDIVLSTDDREIARYCAPTICAQMRPAELATDTASKWDVFRYIAQKNNLKPDDILVDLDTGCPLREPRDITACVAKLSGDKHYSVIATAYEAERNPYFNMVEDNGSGFYYPCCDRTGITRRQDAPQVYSLSPSVFAMRVSALTRFEHWSQAALGIVVIPRERAWDIDTELDWRLAEFLMRDK